MYTRNDVLQRALDVLDRDGWCKGTLQNADGQLCLMGALQKGAAIEFGYIKAEERIPDGKHEIHDWDLERTYRSALRAVENVLPINQRELLDDIWAPGPASYNDHSSTTEEDIKLLLKRAMEE
jgi:hypothetical protein